MGLLKLGLLYWARLNFKTFDHLKPFKIDEKCFLFYLEGSFHLNFVSNFWSFRKTAWLKRSGYSQNLWHHNLVNKQLLHNISKSKDNQTMKFGHSIEWEIFFLKNHTQNVVEKVFLDPPLKNQNWTYQYSKASYSLLLLCAKFRAINTLKLSCRPLDFTSYMVF